MAQIFETKSCNRCGGSGQYSFNLMHGSTCYGCSGTGLQLTKRGIAARKFYHESMTKHWSEIKVGDFVLVDISMFGGAKKWCKVEEIRPCSTAYIVNGERVPGGLHFELSRNGKSVMGYGGIRGDMTFESVCNQQELNQKKADAVAYQATLDEKGKIPKVSKRKTVKQVEST